MNDLALERAVVNAALWGDQAADLETELRAAASTMVDPWCSAVVSAIADVVQRRDIQTLAAPGAVAMAAHEHLVARGVDDFAALVMPDVDCGTLNALPWLLGRLREAKERRQLRARLAALANTLEHPGGPERVAQALGVAA